MAAAVIFPKRFALAIEGDGDGANMNGAACGEWDGILLLVDEHVD